MDGIRVLLCDLATGNGVGHSVRCILESDPHHQFILRQEVLAAPDPTQAVRQLGKLLSNFCPAISFLLCGEAPPPAAGELIRALRSDRPDRPVLVVAETKDPTTVTELYRYGATDVFIPPLRAIDILRLVRRLAEHLREEDSAVCRLKEDLGLRQFVGESPALLAELRKIPRIARCEASLLILGETGTGKDVYARAVHHLSPRSTGPFTPVNCGGIPIELVENELFGHESGAFTSATASSPGLIRSTDGGTLFLDEIDSLPLPAQAKLLRFLEDKQFKPLGSHKFCQADVRTMAATNANLEDAVGAGRFREDLYYRLRVIALTLPPLRERGSDVELLARHFLEKHAGQSGNGPKALSPAVLDKLMQYHWPGNVRELEHVIQAAAAFSEQTVILEGEIVLPRPRMAAASRPFKAAKAQVLEQFEREYVTDMLRANGGNITKAAHMAKKNRRTFWGLMQKHHILPHRP